ncbi:MAG TPA: O-antigen ligase family protein [Cyclobacteriaceae bacterium]|nr:O-antigen ligase family protein [Cyclobacteriaceae bacterium]
MLALIAIALSIPLPIRVNSAVSISVLCAYLIFLATIRKFDFHFFKTPIFKLVLIHATIVLLGLTHTSDLTQGFADVERFGYALLFPFLIFQMRDSGVTIYKVICAFAVGCGVLILYGLIYVLTSTDFAGGKSFWDLGHTYFTNPMDIHPMYLSMYVTFVIFFLLEMSRLKLKSRKQNHLTFIGLSIVFLVIVLFFIRSQMALLSSVILFVLYLVIVLKRRAWLVTFVLFTVGLLVFLLDTQRVATFFDTYGRNVSSALDNRFHVWKGAVEAIKSSPIIGGGTGAEHEMLNKAYVKIGYLDGELNSYNAHNQYLEFLIRNGPAELVVFLVLLAYAFKQSLRFPNHLFLLFCMMFTLTMFFESSLQLHKGLVFFYFFLSCFLFLRFDDLPEAADSPKNS